MGGCSCGARTPIFRLNFFWRIFKMTEILRTFSFFHFMISPPNRRFLAYLQKKIFLFKILRTCKFFSYKIFFPIFSFFHFMISPPNRPFLAYLQKKFFPLQFFWTCTFLAIFLTQGAYGPNPEKNFRKRYVDFLRKLVTLQRSTERKTVSV